jgi:hypothetical protein
MFGVRDSSFSERVYSEEGARVRSVIHKWNLREND